MVNEIYIIRFAVCAKHATDDDMRVAFLIIQEHADAVLAEHSAQRAGRQFSSTDSLDLVPKATASTTNDHDTTVAEEVVHPEVIPENANGPTIYPMTKARVSDETLEDEAVSSSMLFSARRTPSRRSRRTIG